MGEVGCWLRLWVSDVSALHRLRDSFLSREFEARLMSELRGVPCRPGGARPSRDATVRDATPGGRLVPRITVDSTQFAEQCQATWH